MNTFQRYVHLAQFYQSTDKSCRINTKTKSGKVAHDKSTDAESGSIYPSINVGSIMYAIPGFSGIYDMSWGSVCGLIPVL